jgi:hypothetical protein
LQNVHIVYETIARQLTDINSINSIKLYKNSIKIIYNTS